MCFTRLLQKGGAQKREERRCDFDTVWQLFSQAWHNMIGSTFSIEILSFEKNNGG
jgi:hypothetical protein